MQIETLSGWFPIGHGRAEGAISGVAYDSRKVAPGDLFVALVGDKADGHHFLEEAAARGAAALLVDEAWWAARPRVPDLPVLTSSDTRWALAKISAELLGRPSEAFRLVGVTGTNGKTTTTHLVEAVMREALWATGLIGTLGSRIHTDGGEEQEATGHTTPQSLELQRLFARMRDLGIKGAAMEVSSHALDQRRVAETAFDVAVFTNLTVDHLDYHGDMESYAQAKERLFAMLAREGVAVVNRDDPAHPRFLAAQARHGGGRALTYGLEPGADVRAEEVLHSPTGSHWVLRIGAEQGSVALKLPGAFNVSNALGAAAATWALGIPVETIARGLSRAGGVPGRVEVVSPAQCPFTVLVDYAHTPDGLANVLSTARQVTGGRLIVVFGCGGDRDRTKRPQMGRIATTMADLAFLTSDNPRSEDPLAILAEVEAGCTGDPRTVPDRREAIAAAIAEARPGDVVLIAGKGHEAVQILADRTVPFDDRQVARELLC